MVGASLCPLKLVADTQLCIDLAKFDYEIQMYLLGVASSRILLVLDLQILC